MTVSKHFEFPLWATPFQDSFSSEIKARGKAYFNAGKVTILRSDNESLDAVVKGSRPYLVKISRDSDGNGTDDDLHVSCTCPHFSQGYLCKHLYATLLAAGERSSSHSGALDRLHVVDKKKHWRDLLRLPAPSSSSPDIAYSNSGGDWKISYHLDLDKYGLLVSAFKQRILKNGQPGKQLTCVQANILDIPNLSAVDRRVLEALASLQSISSLRQRDYWRARNRNAGLDDVLVDRFGARTLLPDLAETGRCTFRMRGKRLADPLRLGTPTDATVDYELDTASLALESHSLGYIPVVVAAGERIPLAEIQVRFLERPLYFVHKERLYRLPDVDADWIDSLREVEFRIQVPKSEARDLYLAGTESSGPTISIPEELAPTLIGMDPPVPCLELDPPSVGEAISARLFLEYSGKEIDARDTRPALLDVDSWTRIERQPVEEALLKQRLLQVGVEEVEAGFILPGESLFDALETLEPLMEAGWRVRGRDKRVLAKGECAQVRITSSGVDWFDLEGDVSFDDVIIPLPKVVRAWLRGETSITLDDGRVGVLPRGWLDQYGSRLGLGVSTKVKAKEDGSLHFHNAHALILDELIEQADVSRVGTDFSDFRRRLKSFEGVCAPSVPQTLCGALRPYQCESLGWFDFLASFGFGGVLADDMGLGKTLSVLAWIALLCERNVDSPGPVLVVAPTSLVFHWQQEAERFCPSLRVLPYVGQKRLPLLDLIPSHDLIVTTYGVMRRDIMPLKDIMWRLVVLDESQAIKNPDAQTTKAARLLQAEQRICMTGTPLENKLDELWSQLNFLNPNVLGSRKDFDERFTKPVADGHEQAKSVLQALVKPFILRRTKKDVADDLPEKQESVLVCEPTPAQAKIYAKLRNHYRSEILSAIEADGLGRSKIKVIEGLLRLRQVACHPALVGEPKAGSGKLESMIERLSEVVSEGHKALVFSQFTKFLALIQERLNAIGIDPISLTGSTPLAKRKEHVETFQSPGGPPVFLISLKAGGVGLNLTAADYVFIMDPWWNPAAEAQAMDRAHRIGQTKTVFAYKLICKDTIDEQVLKLQDSKKDLARIIEHGTTSTIASLSRADLEALFS